jgi:MYXO-CTERM domain-containing protein
MRRAWLLLALLTLASQARAQDAPQMTTTAPQPPLLVIGQEATSVMQVQFCYRAGGAVPATIAVSAKTPSWLSATPDPAQFQGSTGGSRCGTQDVTWHLLAARDAPAFTAGNIEVTLTGRATGGSSDAKTTFIAQVDYAAELKVDPPARIQAPRGDLGTIRLTALVGANDGTKLEVTGNDPGGNLNIVAQIVTTGAGHGLDAPDRVTVPLTVTVSPGAPLGVQRIQLRILAQNAKSPTIVGPSLTVNADVEVVAASGGGTPGPAIPLVLAGLGALALLARRRRS